MSRRLLLSALLAASLLVAFEAGRASASRSATSSIPAPATAVRAPDVRGIGEPDPSLPFPTPLPVIPRGPSATRGAASVPGTVRGVASWYATGPSGLYAAAGPALRAMLGPGWRGRWVTVRAGGRAIRVRIVDWCRCPGGRVIDLDARSFAALAPLSRGLVVVVVR